MLQDRRDLSYAGSEIMYGQKPSSGITISQKSMDKNQVVEFQLVTDF